MPNPSRNFIYFLIFSCSFFMLSLQIFLCSLLRIYVQMTFFAVSFAFLGLSSAGVYSYFKFKANKEMPSLSVFAKYFNLFGLFFIHYFIIWTILQSGFVDDLMNKIILEKKGGFLNLLEVNFLLFII